MNSRFNANCKRFSSKNQCRNTQSHVLNPFTKCTNTEPRSYDYINEYPKPIKLTKIEEFKLDNNKGCLITGEPGTGKTYMCKGLQQELLNVNGNSF